MLTESNAHERMSLRLLIGLALLLILFLLILSLRVRAAPKQTDVGGHITQDTTWDLAGSPYNLTSDVTVDSGVVLTIELGVEVNFDCDTMMCLFSTYPPNLIISGTLVADGTPASPVLLHSPDPAEWGGKIHLTNDSTNSLLDNVRIEHMGYYTSTNPSTGYALQIDTSSAIVSNSTITGSDNIGIYIGEGASPTIIDNVIVDSDGYGLSSLYASSQPVVTSNTFIDDAIYVHPVGVQNIRNNAVSQVTVVGTVLDQSVSWGMNNDAPYIIGGGSLGGGSSLIVSNGATLELESGIKVQFSGLFSRGSMVVNPGAMLILEPGVEMLLNPGYVLPSGLSSIVVSGTLIADGTPTEPILLHNTDSMHWGGKVHLTSSSTDSLLDNVRIARMGYYTTTGSTPQYALQIDTSSAIVSNCTITDSDNVGIYIGENASPTVVDNVIAGSDSHGLSSPYASSQPVVTGNIFIDDVIYIHPAGVQNIRDNTAPSVWVAGGTLDQSVNWGLNGDASYSVRNNLTVSSGATLTLESGLEVHSQSWTVDDGAKLIMEPGVEVSFTCTTMSCLFFPHQDLIVSGTLIADGTSVAPILLHHSYPSASWGGKIHLTSSSTDSMLDNVYIERMGYYTTTGSSPQYALQIDTSSAIVSNSIITDSNYIGIYIGENASPTIVDNVIAGNDGYGLYSPYANSQPMVTNNTFVGYVGYYFRAGLYIHPAGMHNVRDNNVPYVWVVGDTVDQSVNWGLNGDASYSVRNNLTVGSGATLTLESGLEVHSHSWTVDNGAKLIMEPGVEVSFGCNLYLFCYLNHYNGLVINGTLTADGTPSAPIRLYNAYSTGFGGKIHLTSSSINSLLDNVYIERMGYYTYTNPSTGRALQIDTSSAIVSNSTITDSDHIGIYVGNNAQPTIVHSSIVGNDTYGLYNASGSVTVTTENNWWGHTSGPYHPALNPGGQGDRVSDKVDFVPWLGAQPTTANLSGIVLDATTNNPISDVLITITGTSQEIITATNEDGQYIFHNISTGKYQFQATKEGFDTYSTLINVIDDTPHNPLMYQTPSFYQVLAGP